MMKLSCTSCSKIYEPGQLFTCSDCGGILSIVYNYPAIKKGGVIDKKKSKIWRFWRLLPFENFPNKLVTLNEGGTPLVKVSSLGKSLGFPNLYCKDEGKNPSGSFKDRAIAVGFNRAIQDGGKKVMVWSSGNAAISLASFAQKAGIRTKTYIEAENKEAIKRCRQLGTEVVEIQDNKSIFRDLKLLVFTLLKNWENSWQKEYLSFFKREFRKGWYPVQPNSIINPYQIEGNKTISYEICEELRWVAPDIVVSPGITGDLFLGQWRGYQDLYNLGLIQKLPQMILVARKKRHPVLLFNSLVVKALKDSKGEILYTSEEQNERAQRLILKKEKLKTETISASTVAVFKDLEGKINGDKTIVCVLSGGNVAKK